MGSCSFDNSIQVFSITTGKTYCKVTTKDRISSLDWNYNGSLIGIMNSDKNAYVYDPRGNKEVLHTKAHGSQKCQKMVFVDPNYFSTTGFDNGKREIKLFDMRNFEKPVNTLIIDSSSGVMFPFYDYDSHCIFIPGRGEQTIYFYAFNEGNISKLNDEYKMPISPKSFGMLEKCFVDYENCEMEIQNSIFCSPNKANIRTVTDVRTETRNILIKDYSIVTETKNFKTGIIFKDTHYYQTQRVIPKDHYQKQERTVTHYSDGTVSYGDWRNV
jgi:WD40 repeat protein